MSLPPYPRYRDSGIEWLGEVPEHWNSIRLGALFREADDVGSDELPVLSVSIHDGVSDREFSEEEQDRKVTRSEDRTKYKRVQPGDLVYNMMRAWQGGFGSVTVPGMVSPAYVVARPLTQIRTEFIEQLLRTPQAIEELRRNSHGVTDFRLRLYWDEFRSINVAVPSMREQSEILDRIGPENAKIDALIAEQQRLILLLKEKRQAVISHAVTKGLNPAAPMKDSGIGWLGDIPRHWDLRPLKYLATFKSGGTPDKARPEFWDGEVPWASAKDLKVNALDDTQDHITDVAISSGAASLVAQGSLLVVVRGMILARTFPVVRANNPMAINQDLKAILPTAGMSSDYLAWLLRGSEHAILSCLDEAAHGTKALRMDRWGTMPLPVPAFSEQAEIAVYVEKTCAFLSQLMEEAERGIVLLQERRTALISAAVTGKIDVRRFSTTAREKEAAA